MRRIAVVGASLAGLEAAVELRRSGFAGELVIAGREAFLAGRMEKRLYANASSPMRDLIGTKPS